MSGTAHCPVPWLGWAGCSLLLTTYNSLLHASDPPTLHPKLFAAGVTLPTRKFFGIESCQGDSNIAAFHGAHCSWRYFVSLFTPLWKAGRAQSFTCPALVAVLSGSMSFCSFTGIELGGKMSLSLSGRYTHSLGLCAGGDVGPYSQLKWAGFSKYQLTILFGEIFIPPSSLKFFPLFIV